MDNLEGNGTGHRKILQLPRTESKTTLHMDGGQYRNQTDYILLQLKIRALVTKNKTSNWLRLSLHQILTTKFRLKLKKIGKLLDYWWPETNPFDYTVELTNWFKGLDLKDGRCLKLLYREAVAKKHSQEKKYKEITVRHWLQPWD